MAEFKGVVVKQLFAAGSKSEREALFLETKADRYLLRRMGGNPYQDSQLESLVGKTIKAQGEVDDYTLFVSEWKVIED